MKLPLASQALRAGPGHHKKPGRGTRTGIKNKSKEFGINAATVKEANEKIRHRTNSASPNACFSPLILLSIISYFVGPDLWWIGNIRSSNSEITVHEGRISVGPSAILWVVCAQTQNMPQTYMTFKSLKKHTMNPLTLVSRQVKRHGSSGKTKKGFSWKFAPNQRPDKFVQALGAPSNE